MNAKKILVLIAVCLCWQVLVPLSARAISYSWLGGTGANTHTWSRAQNWNPNGPPNATDATVTINGGSLPYVDLNQNATVNSIALFNTLNILNNFTLTLGGNTPSITNSGTINVNSGGTITGYGTLGGTGTFSNSGTVTASGGTSGTPRTLIVSDNISNNASGIMNTAGQYNTLDLQSTITGASGSQINPAGGTVALDGATLNGTMSLGSGTVTVIKDSTIGGTATSTSTIEVQGGKTLSLNNGTLTNNGSVTIDSTGFISGFGTLGGIGTYTNNGSVIASTPDASTRVLHVTNTFSASGGTIGANTNATFSYDVGGTLTSTNVNMGGGTLGSTTTGSFASGNLSGFGFISRPFDNLNGTITASGGTLQLTYGTPLSNAGALTIQGSPAAFDNATSNDLTFPSITMAGGTLQSSTGKKYSVSNTLSGYGTIGAILYNNGTATADNPTALEIYSSFRNYGTLNVGTSVADPTGLLRFSGSGLLENKNVLNIYGTLENTTGSQLLLKDTPSSSVNLAGGTLTGSGGFNDNGDLNGYGTISATLYNVGTVNINGGTLNVTGNGQITGPGDVTISGSGLTLSNSNNLNANNFTMNPSTTLATNNNTINLTGNFSLDNTALWNGNTLDQPASTGSRNLKMTGGTIDVPVTLTYNGATFNLDSLTLGPDAHVQLVDNVPNAVFNIGSLIAGGASDPILDLNHILCYVDGQLLTNGFYKDTQIFVENAVPIPPSALLLGSGLLVLGLLGWRRKIG